MAKPKTILVVDDQPFIAKLIEFNLARHNYVVVPCRDPLQALATIEALQPDLLIVDIRMPVMSGTELCQRLRTMPCAAATPIIVLTSQGQADLEAEARAAGANVFMTKPFSPRVLAAKVNELLAAVAEPPVP